jgi:hypothetical protein
MPRTNQTTSTWPNQIRKGHAHHLQDHQHPQHHTHSKHLGKPTFFLKKRFQTNKPTFFKKPINRPINATAANLTPQKKQTQTKYILRNQPLEGHARREVQRSDHSKRFFHIFHPTKQCHTRTTGPMPIQSKLQHI